MATFRLKNISPGEFTLFEDSVPIRWITLDKSGTVEEVFADLFGRLPFEVLEKVSVELDREMKDR